MREYNLQKGHSGLMFAARITLAHFSVSAAMSLPKSAGKPGSTVPPKSTSRALIFGSARAALISLLSFPTISVAVPGRAETNQGLAHSPAGTRPRSGRPAIVQIARRS